MNKEFKNRIKNFLDNYFLILIDKLFDKPNLENGLIEETDKQIEKAKHFVYGLLGATNSRPMKQDGNFEQFIPVGEQQNIGFEKMWCFPYNTEVLMEDFNTKRISDINIGDYVISHTGKKQRVSDVMKRKYNGKLYSIKIEGLYKEIKCTEEHPFLTNNGWKKANELTKEDGVYLPTTNKLIKDLTINEVEKKEDFLYLLGMYIAEGSINYERCINFSFSNKEENYADDIINTVKNLFGFELKKYFRDDNTIAIQGSNKYLGNLLLELCGKHCDKKEINKRLMFLSPEKQIYILKGWLDGDGCYDEKNKRIVGVTTSKKLCEQMQRICLRNNIRCNLGKRKEIENKKDVYSLTIYGENCNTLTDWNIKNKNTYSKNFEELQDDYIVLRIKEIKQEKWNKADNVYNIEVENDNSYIVESVAVHNCVSENGICNQIETDFNYYIWLVNNGKADEDTKEFVKIFKHFGLIVNDKCLLDTPYVASGSGTTRRGNMLSRAANFVRKHGLTPKGSYPAFKNWNELYYPKGGIRINGNKLPKDLLDKGNKLAKYINFTYEWVKPQHFEEVAPMGAMGTSAYAWQYPENGIYKAVNYQKNHVIYKFKKVDPTFKKIGDSYPPFIKKLALNYSLGNGILLSYGIKKKFNIFQEEEIKNFQKQRGVDYLLLVETYNDFKPGLYKIDDGMLEKIELPKAVDEWIKGLAKAGKLIGINSKDFSRFIT